MNNKAFRNLFRNSQKSFHPSFHLCTVAVKFSVNAIVEFEAGAAPG